VTLKLKDGTPSQRAAAGELILALHAAKQELAADMEANLKQLKSVLEETKRIAKDMEDVLKEAKAERHSAGDLSQGMPSEDAWTVPHRIGSAPAQVPHWEPPSAAGTDWDSESP